MQAYNPRELEPRWQQYWEQRDLYRAQDGNARAKRYVLDMFPYPSGEGLHVGHVEGYTATDVISRYLRMRGENVLHPMGWDAFGLPAENYAIQTKTHPKHVVEQNIARFRQQLKRMGFSYDWSREINTTDPAYYKWTQWIFLKLFERGLAYESEAPINFCPKDKTGLANEEVVNGRCERCGSEVERKMMRQWMLKITAYADRLLSDLEDLQWPERIKEMQKNWIGRSAGVEIDFLIRCRAFEKVLLATTNPSKVNRVRRLLREGGITTEVVTPLDVGIAPLDVEEGSDLHANAEAKARAYAGSTDLPVLGIDTGLFLENVEQDPAKVKRSALGEVDARMLVPEEGGRRIFEYYRELAERRGGEIPGYFLDVVVLVLPDGSVRKGEARRDILLTDTSRGTFDHHFPIRTLYKIAATGKYAAEQTEEEQWRIELAPLGRALRDVLTPSIRVFTTRADTLFGATYLVLAPEHPFLRQIPNPKSQIPNWDEVVSYIEKATKKGELERQEEREKTGIKIDGIVAVNPVNGEEIPIFVADYVLGHYGTGAIMAVPAHDERDFAFATTHRLPIKEVVTPDGKQRTRLENAYTGDGILVNSGQFSGQTSAEARDKITEWLERQAKGKAAVHYKLRDWVFSRQRFWGEPIPLVFCSACKKRAEAQRSTLESRKAKPTPRFSMGELFNPGWIAVPEEQLPVTLPDVERYEPTGTGESPLAAILSWVQTTCPKCGGPARRETNTMPQWAGSCWYYLRFLDPDNERAFVDADKERYWMPVDIYVGGAEHAVLHLLYARFWHKVLFDAGLVSGAEPFMKLVNQGLILGPDGQKMSKSRGNIINPDEVIEQYGADTLRMYELFMGPLQDEKPWNTKGIVGLWRFLNKVYAFVSQASEARNSDPVGEGARGNDTRERLLHKTIKRVTEDIEAMKFNTAISALMEFVNQLIADSRQATEKEKETLTLLLAPFAPHLAEELWQKVLQQSGSVHEQPWPTYDKNVLEEHERTIVVQVNGKMRGHIRLRRGATEIEARNAAEADASIAKHLAHRNVVRVVYIPDRLINFVAR